MWKKIYLIALAVAAIVMVFLTNWSYSWLQSIGSPIDALSGFRSTSRFASFWLWISAAALLVLANIVLWNYRTAWALWTTLLYLVIFLLLRALWLDPASFAFISANRLPSDVSALRPFATILLAAGAVAIVYFDQLLVLRMVDRIYPPPEEPAAEKLPPIETAPEEAHPENNLDTE